MGQLRRLLAEPEFLRLWYMGLVLFLVRWLEQLAVAVFVWQHTGSAFLVALMTMLRLVPMALLGAVLGALAERIERRTASILILVVSALNAGVLALLAVLGALQVWHLAVGALVNGISWATDNPVRRMMIGDVVGPERMGPAMSLDVGSNNASRMVGPTIGGLLVATTGIEGSLMLGALLYASALPAALLLRTRNPRMAGSGEAVLERIRGGLRAVRRDRRLTGILIITALFNMFGWPFVSMVPVVGQDVLGMGPKGTGILASMDGLGAFLGAIVVAMVARPAWYARFYIGGVMLYLVAVLVFSAAPGVIACGAAMVVAGMAQSGFSIMQPTLVYLATPPELKARILGILSVCIGMGPLGFLNIGLMAEVVGAQAATALLALEGMAALALTHRWWKHVLRG